MSEKQKKFTEDEIADRQAIFDEIHLRHPRLDDIRKCTKALMASTNKVLARDEQRRAAARGRPIKSGELWVLPIIGPSGSMKSTSMSIVIDEIYADKETPEGDIPVLIVTMRGVKSPKAFQASILEPLDRKQASELRKQTNGYHEDIVNEAIRVQARKYNTRILVIDEAHSILAYDGGKLGPQMARCIHGLVNEGIFSVILMGTEKVERLFKMDDELKSRKVLDMKADLSRFDVAKAEDRGYFFGFIDRLESQMVKDGVVTRKLGLVHSVEDRARLFDMAEGILGTVSRILRLAIRRAMQNGREFLEWKDIEVCFQTWNGSDQTGQRGKKPNHDPFKNNIRQETLDAVALDAKKKQKEPA
ncbi:ATP-binding protein [Bradyrhizobium sp. TM102]|uniref:ATP-binding protein n=1 Tax=Bradyrhizobium sp. TM102 TaxID=2599819 RepID=UPI0012A0CFC5|nr:ATP-binding protein [Bradyrhizobium sp. TM102]BBO14793.1 hypothetical protein TM102_62630 [Bradyrhizobium sp. TM102]